MNRGLYTAATGMWAGQVWLDTVAHNLANANTTAYKRDEIAFEESLLRELRSDGGSGPIIGDIQSGPKVAATATSFERGPVQATGNGLDVAINSNNGMFAVQTPAGVKYTRAGAFALNEQRQVVDQSGYPVLDSSEKPITVTGQGVIKINADGEVTIGDETFGQIARFTGSFQKIGSNLFQVRGTATADESIKLAPECLEGSNVNVVATMIEMIQVQRAFDLAQRSVQTHDETTGALIKSAETR